MAHGSQLCFRICSKPTHSGHFKLNGQVAATKRAYRVILQYPDAYGKEIKDSVLIKNGRFTFKGILKEPVLANLNAKTTNIGQAAPDFIVSDSTKPLYF